MDSEFRSAVLVDSEESWTSAESGDAHAKGVVIDGVRKTYGSVVAVEDLSLSLAPGEILCLLGPSGAGKSTLLNLMTGLIRPDVGRIEFGGRDVTDVPPERRGVGAVFQSFALFPHMSVFDNVAFGLRCQKIAKTEVARRVPEQLESVGLGDKAMRRPHELSGGEQQRVAFARALITKPAVLALDEPFGSLDVQLRGSLRSMVRRMVHRSNVPAILITHDRDDAFGVADRVGIIRKGRLLQVGSLSEVYHAPQSAFVGRFLGEANIVVLTNGQIRTAELGEAATMIRPEHVQLVAPDDGRYAGTFVGSRQGGHLTRSFIDIGGTTLQSNSSGDGNDIGYRSGDVVGVTWDERHIRALEPDPDDFDPTEDRA